MHLIGTYECKLDAKGRLLMPASLKKQLPNSQDGFVLKRAVFDECLELWPKAEWDAMMLKINGLNKFVKKNNDFIRKFMAGVKWIDMDDLGRILIAKDLQEFAKIEKEIVITSKISIIEIWDKKLYEQSILIDDNDFAALAEEVMGTNSDFHGIS